VAGRFNNALICLGTQFECLSGLECYQGLLKNVLTKRQELCNLLSSLQQARQKSQPVIIVKKRFPHSGILSRLRSLGIITSFHEENRVLLVRLNLKSFVKIKALSASISSMDIKSDKKRKGGAFVSIINTDRGLLASTELVEQNIGGRVIISIS